MAQSLHFSASWLYQESAGPTAPVAVSRPAESSTTTEALPPAPPPAPVEAGVAVQAEQAVVRELLQIARTVLTLEITFEAGPPRTAELPVPAGAALFDRPVVLRDGQVYGMLRCVSEDRRTPVGSRPADALRCVAVLVGRELDRYRRRTA